MRNVISGLKSGIYDTMKHRQYDHF